MDYVDVVEVRVGAIARGAVTGRLRHSGIARWTLRTEAGGSIGPGVLACDSRGAARRLADGGGAGNQIVLVQNRNQRASQRAERIGMPLLLELADVLALLSQDWPQKATAIRDVRISRDGDHTPGSLAMAQRLELGLLLDGVEPAMGFRIPRTAE